MWNTLSKTGKQRQEKLEVTFQYYDKNILSSNMDTPKIINQLLLNVG